MRVTKIKLEAIEQLSRLILRGNEGDSDGDGGDDSGDGSGDDSGDGTDDKGADGGDDGGDDDDGDTPDDLDGLKKALKAERQLRKKAERGEKLTARENKKLKRAQDEIADAEKTEVDKAKKAAESSSEKVSKLAAKLRTSSLESAITKVARAQNFRDPDDVLAYLHRVDYKGIEIDQDEDDPADIEIDEKTVERAVKAIATSKPHWLLAEGETTPSGSKFGGGNNKKTDEKTRQQQLAERFPSLKNRMPQS